ncbi:MAG: molybdopterin-dependent oxidoreductase [Burkholderiales bacterium]|nr:MAG: molybdopterin-dependent oxidoreductase [Burkholderiales bacterium]
MNAVPGASSPPGEHWVKSHCQQCFNACGIEVEVRDRKPVRIRGDVDDPNTRGHLCARGLAGAAKFYDPHRLTRPLIRTNPQKARGVDPGWREASWDEALDLVAARLRKIRSENPNKLICSLWPYEKYIQSFAWPAAFGTANGGFCFSGVSNQCANPNHFIGMLTHGALVEFPDLKYCNYLLLLGSEYGFGAYQSFVRVARELADARARGLKLVVADPRLSVAAGKADQWLPIRPATDLALLLAMIHLLVHEYRIYDADWLRRGTNAPYLLGPERRFVTDAATGKPLVWDPVAGAARPFDAPDLGDFALEGGFEVDGTACMPCFQYLKDETRAYTPEWAAAICDIDAQTIRTITREFAEAACIGQTITIDGVVYPYRPAAILSYRGLQAHTNGALAMMAQETVLMLVGALGVPGGLLAKSMDARRFGGAARGLAKGPDGMIRPQATGWHLYTPFAYPPQTLELREYAPLATDLGHLVPRVTLDPASYGIDYAPEALVIFHSNPFTNSGDNGVIERALAKLDLVVSINIYLDESTDFADVVLPEHTNLERYNLVNWTHDMRGLQVSQPVTAPLHDTMDGMDILIELAERAGFLYGEGGFNARLNGTLGLAEPHCLALDRKYSYEQILDVQARCHSQGERDLAWYRRHGNDLAPLEPHQKYRIYGNGRLPLFYNTVREVGLELEANLQEHRIEERHGLAIRTDVYKGLPYWEASPVHEPDAEFDLYLISYKSYMTTYADTATNPILMDLARRDPNLVKVVINRVAARSRGLRDGDPVWVESRHARARGIVGVTEGIHPETAAVSGGFGRRGPHPVGRGVGLSQNAHLAIDLAHSGMLGGSMETAGRVRIYRCED